MATKTIVRPSISLCKDEDQKNYQKISDCGFSDLDIFRMGLAALDTIEYTDVKKHKTVVKVKGLNARAKA